MWLSLEELGVRPREEHFKLGKVEDEIKKLVQKKYVMLTSCTCRCVNPKPGLNIQDCCTGT